MHERLMQRCLELAIQAHGRTAPNPMVGALVVDDEGSVLAEGYHRRRGEPHAEPNALNLLGEKARGQTMYVSLEPCSHFGKTPPCADAVIASGIKKVVAGMVDPNPKVAGQGLEKLRAAGIEVVVGVLETECRWLNRGFVKRVTRGLPWVHLKMAVTLDGRIADRQGASRWITGGLARQYVHELRNICDVVIVGGATVAADDPQLTVRDVEGGRDPRRAVVSPKLGVPADRRIFKESGATIFTAAQNVTEEARLQFGESTTLVGIADCEPDGIDLTAMLRHLAAEGANEVLCEGGGHLAAALLQAGLVDELHWFVAPRLLVDGQAIASLAGSAFRGIGDALALHNVEMDRLGEDMLIHGVLQPFN